MFVKVSFLPMLMIVKNAESLGESPIISKNMVHFVSGSFFLTEHYCHGCGHAFLDSTAQISGHNFNLPAAINWIQ